MPSSVRSFTSIMAINAVINARRAHCENLGPKKERMERRVRLLGGLVTPSSAAWTLDVGAILSEIPTILRWR